MGIQPCNLCGYPYDRRELGAAGCPNCLGEGGPPPACARCNLPVRGPVAWLELNARTGRYFTPGTVADRDSHGCIPFDRGCRNVVLLCRGELVKLADDDEPRSARRKGA